MARAGFPSTLEFRGFDTSQVQAPAKKRMMASAAKSNPKSKPKLSNIMCLQ